MYRYICIRICAYIYKHIILYHIYKYSYTNTCIHTHIHILFPGISTPHLDRNNEKNLKPEKLNFENSNNESSKNNEKNEKNENEYKNSGYYVVDIDKMALNFNIFVYIFIIEYV
jgi:hypothetical protein